MFFSQAGFSIEPYSITSMKKFNVTAESNFENNPFDRQERIEWWDQKRLAAAKVLVVGAGAIGNETLKNLALLGVGHIFIVDFDEISTSNLSRTVLFRKEDTGRKKAEVAAERMRELVLQEDTRISWLHGDVVWELGTGLFREVDLVLGCLDNIETRFAVNRQCMLAKTPWIDAGISELGLRVNFYRTPHPPCYQCAASPEQLAAARKRYSCDDFKRRFVSEGKIPTVQIASAIVSALQVQEAVKFLCGQDVAAGKQIYFQGKNNDFDIFSIDPAPECTKGECGNLGTFPDVEELSLSSKLTVKDFLTEIEKHFGEKLILDFRGDRTFVVSASCRCARRKPISYMRPTFRIYDDETLCAACQSGEEQPDALLPDDEQTQKVTLGQFSLAETPKEVLALSLRDLGVPLLHVLSLRNSEGKYRFVQLQADKSELLPGWE